uniref:Phosphorylated adapter RNA export protein n=1 Tax=Tanacetum cinerariifolium TaxID=118510 RepID=A0A6L2N8S2_TANCI|nr:putative phosphorylated adapter RNA export protein, RNA-binding domain-containing protein [Tanacetum cinerariifolium]
MEGEDCLLDSIFDVDNVEDMEDVDMVDVEGELVGESHQRELGQNSSVDGDPVAQQPQSKNQRRRNKKKKNKKRKGGPGSDVTDINRFVLDTCRRLKEKKSYLVWTAVGCLGVPALSDLVKEVDAIQACGGQKTVDGRRYRNGGGILWSILKVRDPNAFKEIMKKGKEFEKQFNKPDMRKAPNQNNETYSEAEIAQVPDAEPIMKDENLSIEERPMQKRPVHERIRVPVSYDDLVEVEEPKDDAIYFSGDSSIGALAVGLENGF